MMNNTKSTFTQLLILAALAVFLMSFVPVLIKWSSASATTIGIIRLAIAALGILIIIALKKSALRVTKQEILWLGLLGLVFAIHWYTYFLGIKLASASLAAIGVATYGVHLVIFSSWLKKEKIAPIDYLALLLCLIGVLFASPDVSFSQFSINQFNLHQLGLNQLNTNQSNFLQSELFGFLLALISGALYACLPLINQKIGHLSTHTRALGQFSFALVAFLIFMPPADYNLTFNDWLGLGALGVFCTLIGHTLWVKVSTELPNNITAVIYYAYVPLAMILSVIFLNESMGWQKMTGASLIILANVMLVAFHKTKKPLSS